ncbi:MAG TPA: NADPH-dependent glutamate synthase [Firmicutes bacterium]|nr:NADPH-dependent glutamate synthase [Bacillota bacterium]
MYKIVAKRVLNPITKLFLIDAPMVAKRAQPGQFVIVRTHPDGERIPLTIADYDREQGTVTIVFQEVGKTTRLLGSFQAGDELEDFVGPLGVPMELPEAGPVLCVAGGVGVAPIYPKARALYERGIEVISVIGARSADLLVFEEEMRSVSKEPYITTDDGSRGEKGLVTDVVRRLLAAGHPFAEAIAIGPPVMMKATCDVTREFGLKTLVSLDPIMVDGTGMCGACRVTIAGETKFCCVDGPIFNGHDVDWEELAKRKTMYRDQEQISIAHQCRCSTHAHAEQVAAREEGAARNRGRVPMRTQDAQLRRRNFGEVAVGYSEEEAREEAARCLNCKNPLCRQGCPVEVQIPDFICQITAGDYAGAYQTILETNSLPAVCGRVCPQESQCEATCILAKKGQPVAIGRLERFVADWSRAQTDSVTDSPRDKDKGRVAVIGAGPAGLTCAGDLARKGYAVTIYEALHAPGGVLIYGIPEFRLPKEIVQAEVEYVRSLGVEVVLNAVIGRTLTLDDLWEMGYDAIFLGTGAGLPRFMGIPGENLLGVYSANEYLTRINLMKAYRFPDSDTPIRSGRRVVVVGGGNVAMDSVRCALRLGAQDAVIVYRRSEAEMPARLEEVEHAKEEGVQFEFLTNPTAILPDENGWVRGMVCQRMKLGEPDASGRRRPVPVPDSEFVIECDTVVMALGTKPNPLLTSQLGGLELTKWGGIVADEETGATTLPGVYAGGDAVTGAATVIQAMGAGKKAAKAIHEFIAGKSRREE